MIYSVNFLDMVEKLNPHAVCKYLEQTGWNKFPFKRTDIKIYQMMVSDELFQVTVPLDRELCDFKTTMYDTVNRIAEYEHKSVEQVMLYLLNPNTDIIKIHLDKKEGYALYLECVKCGK